MNDIQSYIFNQKFGGKVWKTLSNTSGKYLAIEVRDEFKHQVSFFILNIDELVWLWENVTFEEQWWINLQVFDENQLQFIYYEDGNSPEQKQQLIIDIHTKQVLDSNNIIKKTRESSEIITPSLHYLESSNYFKTVSEFLKQKLNISPVKGVDYLENQGLVVISYYIWQSDHLANFLLLMDQKGSVKTHILLANKLASIGIDTFFVIRSLLFTVRQKEELLIYEV